MTNEFVRLRSLWLACRSLLLRNQYSQPDDNSGDCRRAIHQSRVDKSLSNEALSPYSRSLEKSRGRSQVELSLQITGNTPEPDRIIGVRDAALSGSVSVNRVGQPLVLAIILGSTALISGYGPSVIDRVIDSAIAYIQQLPLPVIHESHPSGDVETLAQVVALSQSDRWPQARLVIDQSIHHPLYQTIALATLAKHQAARGDHSQAQHTLMDAVDRFGLIHQQPIAYYDGVPEIDALNPLLQAMSALAETTIALDAMMQLVQVVATYDDDYTKAYALSSIAEATATLPQPTRSSDLLAKPLIKRSLQVASTIQDDEYRVYAMNAITHYLPQESQSSSTHK